jgi:hypothetical protein
MRFQAPIIASVLNENSRLLSTRAYAEELLNVKGVE